MYNHSRITGSILIILIMTVTAVAPTSAKVSETLLADPIFVVSSTAPQPNELDVDPATPVGMVFNLALNTDTVTTETLTVHGDMTGFYRGPISYPTGYELVLSPTMTYKPGEKINVTASSGISSSGSEPLSAHTWEFTAKTGWGSGEFYPHPDDPTFGSGYSSAVALGDIDGDMDLDSVVANRDGPTRVYTNSDGLGSFNYLSSFGTSFSSDVKLSDLDNDGDLDAVVANYLDNTIPVADTVWLNNGAGLFSSHPITPTFGTTASRRLTLGDINGDGTNDVLVVNATSNHIAVWVNSGDGGLISHPITPFFGDTDPRDVALGDLDLDGDLDAVVANAAEDPQTVWLNDGEGTFTSHPITPTFGISDSWGIALGDLDNDGDLDAVVANRGESATQPETVWLNDGSGSFSPHPLCSSFGGSYSNRVDLGDIDGDGDLDAVITNENSFYQTVWVNDGTGCFSQHPSKATFGDGRGADTALGDLDADGDLDAVSANTKAAQLGEANTTWLNLKLDIAINKLVSPDRALPSETVSYKLQFSHPGEVIAKSFFLTDTLPIQLTDLQYSATPELELDRQPGPPYFWEVSNPTGLISGTVTITGTVVVGLAAGTIIINDVSIFNPSDINAANDQAEVEIEVLNAAPELDYIGDQFTSIFETLTFTASADDLNWDDLTFYLSGAPAGATIHPTTGLFSWNPSAAHADNTYTFDVCVSDGELDDCEEINVTVSFRLNFLPIIKYEMN